MNVQTPPLRPKPDTRGGDRRAFTRYQTDETVLTVIGDTAIPCQLSDISLGGALLEGKLPLDNGTVFALCVLDLPEIEVRAVHCGDGFYGVQYTNPTRYKHAIGVWIRRRMSVK